MEERCGREISLFCTMCPPGEEQQRRLRRGCPTCPAQGLLGTYTSPGDWPTIPSPSPAVLRFHHPGGKNKGDVKCYLRSLSLTKALCRLLTPKENQPYPPAFFPPEIRQACSGTAYVMEHPGRVATTSTPTQAPRDFETHSKERKVSHNPARGMGVPWVENTIISLAS